LLAVEDIQAAEALGGDMVVTSLIVARFWGIISNTRNQRITRSLKRIQILRINLMKRKNNKRNVYEK